MADLDPVARALMRGPMPLAQSAKIVCHVCELLAPLHESRRGYGAISPDNIWFRHVGPELTVELRDVSIPSAAYATPERINGRAEGPSSDVYSLGVLFFHMITGAPPFEGTADEILEKHLTQGPPPLGYNDLQDIPIELEALVRAMMAKDPARRPAVRKIVNDIDNLDLDSTVMGVRISAAVLASEDAPDMDTALLRNVEVDVDHRGRTDPQLVDPYADTLIKNRSDFGPELADILDSSADTHLTLPVVQKKPTSGWNEDATRILDHRTDHLDRHEPPTEGEPPAAVAPSPMSSRLLFGFGIVFFVAAIATAAFVWIRT